MSRALSLLLAFLLTTPSWAVDRIIPLNAKVNNQKQPIRLKLHAGRYEIKAVPKARGGKFSAWSVWAVTNCKKTTGCERTIPTRSTGFHTNFWVESVALSHVSINNKPIPRVAKIPRHRMYPYFLIGKSKGFEVASATIFPNEHLAAKHAPTAFFTLKQTAWVSFSLLDHSRLSDNRGGVTLALRTVN